MAADSLVLDIFLVVVVVVVVSNEQASDRISDVVGVASIIGAGRPYLCLPCVIMAFSYQRTFILVTLLSVFALQVYAAVNSEEKESLVIRVSRFLDTSRLLTELWPTAIRNSVMSVTFPSLILTSS